MKSVRALALLVCIATAIVHARPDSGRGTELRAPTEQLSALVEDVERVLPGIRGHGYRAPVIVESMTAEQARIFLKRKLEEEYPDARIVAEEKTYRHFGFLSEENDLKRLFVDLLAHQAAGFYDPDEKRLFLVDGREASGEALVHEMAHALQDQVFDVGGMLEAVREDDDRLKAVHSMIEGEATALASRYLRQRPGAMPDAAPGPAPAPAPQMPAILEADLLFPYVQGMTWALAMEKDGGNGRMDALFREPPDSTEQILHPEKTRSPRDIPSGIDRALLPAAPGGSWKPVKSNTWGEFYMLQLFGGQGDQEARAATTGWDGDRYTVYEDARGRTAMVWITVWDSADDAAEFRTRAESWLMDRHPDGSGYLVGSSSADRRVVWLLEGFDEALAARLRSVLEPALEGGVTPR